MDLGAQIHAWRLARQLTQREFADLIRERIPGIAISQPLVSLIEGGYPPRAATGHAILAVILSSPVPGPADDTAVRAGRSPGLRRGPHASHKRSARAIS